MLSDPGHLAFFAGGIRIAAPKDEDDHNEEERDLDEPGPCVFPNQIKHELLMPPLWG